MCVSDVSLSQESWKFPDSIMVMRGSLLLGAGWDEGQGRAAGIWVKGRPFAWIPEFSGAPVG